MANVQNANSIDQILESSVPFIPGRFIQHRMGQKEGNVCHLDRYQDIIEHRREDQVITVGGGIAVTKLNETLAQYKQWLPIAPARPELTISDCILSGDAGYLEPFCGGMRRLALGVGLAVEPGEPIQFGGKVVKNVTGYDVTKLVVGSYGVFGVPVSVSLRLYALPDTIANCIYLSPQWQPIAALSDAVSQTGIVVAAHSLLGKQTANEVSEHTEYALFLQIAGEKAVVEETLSVLDKLAASNSVSAHRFDQKLGDEQFQNLAKLAWRDGLYYMDIGSSLKIAHEIIGILGDDDFYEYRPGPHRLRIYSNDLSRFEKLAQKCRELDKDSITVSYPVQGGYLQIGYYNENLSTLLYQDLKKRLDPQGLLNPFLKVNSILF